MTYSKYTCVVNITSLLFLSGIYYIFLFEYAFSFNYHAGVDYHYALLTVSFGVSCLLLLFSVLTGKCYQLTRFDFLVCVVFIIFLLRNFTSANIYNESSNNTLILIIAYFVFRHLSITLLTEWFIPIIVVFFLIELYLGCKDIYYNWNTAHLNLGIIGSLKNSGVYAIYLAIHIPMLQFYLESQVRNLQTRRWVFNTIALVASSIVWLTQSRTGLLLIAIFILLNFRTYRFKYRQIIIAAVGLTGIGIFYWLIYDRTGSISGRYLIWKISLLNIKNHLLLGTGYGTFSYVYPQWQISYFKTLPMNNISEILHADETYVAFNEPLQFLIENGLAVSIIAVMVLLKFFLFKYLPKNNLVPTFQIVLGLIVMAGLTSYPLHVNSICFLVCFILAVMSPTVFPKKLRAGLNKCFTYLIHFLGFVGFMQSTSIYALTNRWNTIRYNVFITDSARLNEYKSLYPSLNSNGKFLLDYGELLYLHGHPTASQILEESKQVFFSAETLVFAGKSYESQGDYPRAIENYEQLTMLVPYQFSNRSHLVDLYLKNHDTVGAVREASYILSMPIKKNSVFVQAIKEDMLRLKKGQRIR